METLASGDVHRARAELLQAINHLGLSETDLKELSTESRYKAFERALLRPSKLPLQDVVLLLCCCGEYVDPIRALFYEHGKTYGLLQFVLATSSDPALLEQVGQLPKNDQVILAKRLGRDKPKDLSEFIEENTYATAPKPGDIALRSSVKGLEAAGTPRNDAQEGDSLEDQSPGIKKFEYFEVNQDDFRLLLLERDSKTPEIHCHLIPASRGERFRYEALSYTWGDPSAELRSIWMNGYPFRVTSNLYSALQKLRKSFPYGGQYRFLWIDSLCIDQSNDQDRNHQVSNMGKIYQQAALVLVWLGEQSQDSDQAIDFIEKVHELSNPGVSELYTRTKIEHYVEWKAMNSLFRREYWQRTWIIQEIQLAKDVLFHCGDRVFTWAAAGAFYDFLHGESGFFPSISVMESPAVQLLESTLYYRKRNMNLRQLLYRHEQSKCRESRDKIYGLLALASDCKNSEILPDYKKEISEVYRDALKREISTTGEATAAGIDLVYYSYFLQNILSVSLSDKLPFMHRSNDDPVVVVGYSCGTLMDLVRVWYLDDLGTVPVVCAISDSQFHASKGQRLPEVRDPAASSVMVDQKEARVMALPYGRVVYVPDVAQVGDVLCMFSKHDSTLIIREEDDGSYKLVGNAFVLTTKKKRRERLIPQLRNFKYCIPNYDIWPPPTSNPNERFLIRMSAITLQWMTRV